MAVHEGARAVLAGLVVLSLAACARQEEPAPDAAAAQDVAGPRAAVVAASEVPVGRLPEGATYDFGSSGGGPAEVGGAYVIGRPDAPVSVAAFGDFQCRFCARSEAATGAARRELLESGAVRILYLDFPLRVHPRSRAAAEFARCTGRVAGAGAFWRTHTALHRAQDRWSSSETVDAGLRAVAQDVGAAWSEVRRCMESELERSAVERHRRLGQRVGVRGTPTNFFNGIPRAGAITGAEFRRLVDAARTGTDAR